MRALGSTLSLPLADVLSWRPVLRPRPPRRLLPLQAARGGVGSPGGGRRAAPHLPQDDQEAKVYAEGAAAAEKGKIGEGGAEQQQQ